jgi:hypothetical protein
MSDLVSETAKSVLETPPGKSLVEEVSKLRGEVAQLCQAVRGLVQLISVLDRKVDVALKGNADCAVL